MGKKDESVNALNLEGRLNDGNAFCVDLEGGATMRVCDYDGPEALWARIKAAHAKGDAVTFTGCRVEANGKIDGFAIIDAKKIVGLRNWGPSVLGAAAIEDRLVKVETALAAVVEEVNEIQEELDEDEEEETPPTADGTPPASDAPTPEAVEALKSALSAGDDEDDGDEDE